ncbi:MAG TPA: hypothetical protein VGQ12_02370 [Candidatus Angelobacter sp.]|jgi:hypothetical protein|nr:hypothetical protein [Candidatus Angelobacter sp.]
MLSATVLMGAKSKNPDNASLAMLFQGVLSMARALGTEGSRSRQPIAPYVLHRGATAA